MPGSRTWVRTLKQRRRETGEIAPRRGRVGRKPKIDRARLAERVAEDADATLAELRATGDPVHAVGHLEGAGRAEDHLQKKRCGPPSKIAPTSRSSARRGGSRNSGSIRSGSSLSMKRGPRRT